MKQSYFVPCDNRITREPVFRRNPNHLEKYFPRLWLGVNQGRKHHCCKLSSHSLIKFQNQGGQA